MKKAISMFLLILLMIIYVILSGITMLVKYIQKPLQTAIEKLDKIIYKLNLQS